MPDRIRMLPFLHFSRGNKFRSGRLFARFDLSERLISAQFWDCQSGNWDGRDALPRVRVLLGKRSCASLLSFIDLQLHEVSIVLPAANELMSFSLHALQASPLVMRLTICFRKVLRFQKNLAEGVAFVGRRSKKLTANGKRYIEETSTSVLFGATFNIATFQDHVIRSGLTSK